MSILGRIFKRPPKTKEKGFIGSNYSIINRLLGGGWQKGQFLETYTNSAYVYACVSRIAEKCGSIDFSLHKIVNKDGETEEVYNHEALDLLYKWNPFFTKEEAMEIDTINRLLTGDSFILKVRNERGQVVELWNLRPDLVSIIPDEEKYISHCIIKREDGKEQRVEPDDIIHIRNPSPLEEFAGVSPLLSARTRVDIEKYATEFQRDFFLNNARPDAVLEFPDELTEGQRREARSSWEARHKGRANTSKLGLLWGGAKYHQVSLTQKEMDYINSLKVTRDDILVAFKVPKPIVAVSDGVGRSRAEAETMQEIFLSETIVPEIKKFIGKINEQLIIPEFGEEYFMDFEDPVPMDREQRLKEYELGCDRWLTRNEIRREFGHEPIDGGDRLFIPLGSQDISKELIVAQDQKTSHRRLHGRRVLQKKFEIAEALAEAKEQIKEAVKEENGKIDDRSLFKDQEARSKYHELINIKADKHDEKLAEELPKLIEKQRDGFLAKLKKKKPKNKTDIKKMFDEKKQHQIFRDWLVEEGTPLFLESMEEAEDIITGKAKAKDVGLIETIQLILINYSDEIFSKSVNGTTLGELVDSLIEGINTGESIPKLSKRVKEIYDDFEKYRYNAISRTTATFINNKAHLETYKEWEMEGKEWVATLDDRVRDEHLLMDGEIVPLGKTFSNGLQQPEEPNCRCVIAPIELIK